MKELAEAIVNDKHFLTTSDLYWGSIRVVTVEDAKKLAREYLKDLDTIEEMSELLSRSTISPD